MRLRRAPRTRRRRDRAHLHAPVLAPRAVPGRARRRQTRGVREARGRHRSRTSTGSSTAEAAAGRTVMPVFQYRFGQRPPAGEGAGRRGHRGPRLHVVGRGRVATAGRLLRRAVAGAVGDRARRRALRAKAVHALDMLTYIVGPPSRVFCRVTTRGESDRGRGLRGGVARDARRFAGDDHGKPRVAGGGEPPSVPLRVVLRGIEHRGRTRPRRHHGSSRPTTPEAAARIEEALAGWVDLPEEWQGQFLRFADSLDAGEPPPVTLADARASLELLTALYWSARTGDDVVLPIGDDHPFYQGWLP